MNNMQRCKIRRIIKKLENLDGLISEIREELDNVKNDVEDNLENFPENLKNSSRYEEAEERLFALCEACDELEDIDIENILDNLKDAIS